MSQTCTRCDGTGFLNTEQVDDETLHRFEETGDLLVILGWMLKAGKGNHDVSVCGCCGDGRNWYGTPGEHYNDDDPPGDWGPYGYNGGLCECN